MMLFRHDTRSGVPIYRQLEEQVHRGILSGALAKGQKLPPVREVAAQLGVNPMTVSKAYSHLEIEGWLERRRPRTRNGGGCLRPVSARQPSVRYRWISRLPKP